MARTVTGSGAQLARILRGAAQLLPGLLYRAERQNLRDAKALAQQLSSGPYQPRDLAALGHPYARRRFRPPADPGIINRVRGTYYRGWRMMGPRKNGSGGYTSQLVNVAPQARYLASRGTARMGPRPLMERVEAQMAPQREEAAWRALRDAFLKSLLRAAWKSFTAAPKSGRRG